jgi:electron transfer flavoprotein alpha subunit
VVVLDGTTGSATKQARALGGFLRHGLIGETAAVTLLLYDEAADRERLVEIAPTCDVRLVRTAPRRSDLAASVLTRVARNEGAALFIFAGGPGGCEAATRLACRVGGSVLTDALSLEVETERLVCRTHVYSAHLVGRFELSARPWCVSIDASWHDRAVDPLPEHRVLSVADETDAAGAASFEDVQLVAPTAAGDLAECRFLVVAGRGAGSREGVDRIAAAARRMGADMGVSRPVAMSAWAPIDRLVGVSGARAAPALCIVVGASGAPALHWGIERAARIVAVNPDDQAPIAGNADAVVLDDGVAVLEALAEIVARHWESA